MNLSNNFHEIINEALNTKIKPWGFTLDKMQLRQINHYIHLLMKWAKVINLTAITDPNLIVTKHILDSLSIIPYLMNDERDPLIDVGSGAGLPGLIIAIVFPHKKITLLDSRLKKTQFLRQVVYELKLKNVTVIHARVENYMPEALFKVVIARAVTEVKKFIDLTYKICDADGYFYLMKGRDPVAELPSLNNEIKNNAKINKENDIKIIPLTVPNLNAERHLIIIPKLGLHH